MEQMPQVRYIARHIHDRLPQHVPIEDLVHAGVLGLMDALTKYDEARQVQFKTYAKFRIRGAILDSLRELDWSPRDLRRKARLRSRWPRPASATNSGAPPPNRRSPPSSASPSMSFQHLLGELEGLDLGSFHIESGDKDHDDDLCEYLPGNPEESPYFLTMKSELHDLLVRAIEELSEKEQQVLSLYYYEELTMKETGAVLGVGESRVSQIHSLALLRLRTRLAIPARRQTDAAAPRRTGRPHRTGERMEKVLNQEEIDAMFRAALGRSQGRASSALPAISPATSSRPDRSRRTRSAPSAIFTRASRATSPMRSAPICASIFEVNLVSVEQLTFREFLQRIPDLAYLATFQVKPMGATAALDLEPSLVFPIIDLLLGGVGRMNEQEREITEIEEGIMEGVVRILCGELQTAWSSLGSTFEFDERLQPTQLQRLMPPGDKTLCLSFEIHMPESHGVMNVAFPAVASNALLRRLDQDGGYSRHRGPSASPRAHDRTRPQLPLRICPRHARHQASGSHPARSRSRETSSPSPIAPTSPIEGIVAGRAAL